jgi:Zn-dependent protease with chaperone function
MNTMAIVIAFAGAASFAGAAPFAARRLPPRDATWMISVGAGASALSTTVVLALLAVVLVGQLPAIAHVGEWSSSALHDHAFTEPGVGAAALLALVAAALALIVAGRREVAALVSAYRACRSMPPAVGDLVVLSEGPSDAVAVPGRPGRIVIGESLLTELRPGERRALIAHERAHLDHGHHWHRAAVLVAAAANPMLAPLRSAIVHATERWADEQAASEVGDRRQVATTLARVALFTRGRPGRTGLALAAHGVPERVAALLDRPSSPRPVLTGAILATPLLAVVAAAIVWKNTEHVFELAGRLHRLSGGG